MIPTISKITSQSRQMVKSIEKRCQITIEESDDTIVKLQATMAMGTLFLIDKMSHLMDRSMDLVETQIKESQISREVLELKKELLKKQLKDK
jgi:hypothetical protein